jgi:hypothetical protein
MSANGFGCNEEDAIRSIVYAMISIALDNTVNVLRRERAESAGAGLL